MATILLDRYAATELPATSEYTLFGGVERVLSSKHDILRVPLHSAWSDASLAAWLAENALRTDLMVGSDPRIIKLLRERGWKGKVVRKALGDAPHGASGLRSALPYLHKTDVLWCSSIADKQIYDMLIEQDGAQPEAIVLPYGVDAETFAPLGEAERQRLRRAWGLAPEDFVVVYAGRITIEKNFHSVLEVIHQMLLSGAQLKFLVANRVEDVPFRQFSMYVSDLDAKIHRLADHPDLLSHMKFVPWLDHAHLNELHNIGDVFINLTLATGENFGYAQVEAMSAGLPVVASAWGGLKDAVLDGETGFLSDTWVSDNGIRFDLPKVMNSLELLRREPDLRAALSRRAIERVKEHYAWPVYTERLLGLVEKLLSRSTSESRARFSDFGAPFHSRFSVAEAERGNEPSARSPVFRSLADPDYTRLIELYTSCRRIEYRGETQLFASLTGRISGTLFYSTDLLWPVRIRIDATEARVLQQLSRYEPIARGRLDCSDDVLRSLVKKGLVGVTRCSPSQQ